MKERTKRFETEGIDKNRYQELKYIARQYDAMRKREIKFRNGEMDRTGTGVKEWRQSDPTGNTAISFAMFSLSKKIRAIEESARIAGGGIYKELLLHVSRGIPFEKLYPPCGRAQFYRARRLFYIELDKRV